MQSPTTRRPETVRLGEILRRCSPANRDVPVDVLEERVLRACGHKTPRIGVDAVAVESTMRGPEDEVRSARSDFAGILGPRGLGELEVRAAARKILDAIGRVDESQRKDALGETITDLARIIGMMKNGPERQAAATGLVKELLEVMRGAGHDTKELVEQRLWNSDLRSTVIELSVQAKASPGNGSFSARGEIHVSNKRRTPAYGTGTDDKTPRLAAVIIRDDAAPAESAEAHADEAEVTARILSSQDVEPLEDKPAAVPQAVPKPMAPMDLALFSAIEAKDVSATEEALGAGADVNARDECGQTPFIRAAVNGDRQMAGMLEKWNADINQQDNEGWTALMFAASSGNRQLIIEILFLGARRYTRNNRGETARMLAAGHPEIVKVLDDDVE